jgi:hypothetical protein
MYPRLRACSKVEIAGENNVACDYTTSSAAFGAPIAEFICGSIELSSGRTGESFVGS